MADSDENKNIEQKADSEQNNEEIMSPECVPDLDVALKDLPEEKQHQIKSYVRIFMQRAILPVSNPINSKLTSLHIDKILDTSERDSKRTFIKEITYRIISFFVFLAVVYALFKLLIIYKDNVADIQTILINFMIFAGGFGVGKIKIRN